MSACVYYIMDGQKPRDATESLNALKSERKADRKAFRTDLIALQRQNKPPTSPSPHPLASPPFPFYLTLYVVLNTNTACESRTPLSLFIIQVKCFSYVGYNPFFPFFSYILLKSEHHKCALDNLFLK